jgi:signal transduction histidine kinase
MQELAGEGLDELRGLVHELRPPDLDADGLRGALRKHVEVLRRVHGVAIDCRLEDGVTTGTTDGDREVLRIAQEALQNALKHAAAPRIEVRLGGGGGGVRLVVADDGDGFDPDDPELRSRRLGLTSMEERAGRLGGRLTIASRRGDGTTVELDVAAGADEATGG